MFWKEVATIISKTFMSLYLGHILNRLSKDDIFLLKILLAANKKAITKYWLQKNCPTASLFINTVKHLRFVEQMTYILLPKEFGEKQWRKWCVYLASETDSTWLLYQTSHDLIFVFFPWCTAFHFSFSFVPIRIERKNCSYIYIKKSDHARVEPPVSSSVITYLCCWFTCIFVS